MTFRAATSSRTSVQVGIKLARLLELPEEDFAGRVRELEADVLFRRLLDKKVISVQPYAGAGFMAQRFGGWGLSTASDGVPALDGQGDLARLLQKVGEKRFQECFLSDESYTDDERARLCRISKEEAGRLRELVNSLYVQAEFDGAAAVAAPARRTARSRGSRWMGGSPPSPSSTARFGRGATKSTRTRAAECLTPFRCGGAALGGFPSGSRIAGPPQEHALPRARRADRGPGAVLHQRRPGQASIALTQRDLSDKLDISPSVLNRLISNKSVQLPWGLEAPMKTLVPSRKSLIRDRLHDLVRQYPTRRTRNSGARSTACTASGFPSDPSRSTARNWVSATSASAGTPPPKRRPSALPLAGLLRASTA